jgi:hypothetical protein
MKVSTFPFKVATEVVGHVNVTGNPEEDVAVSVIGASPNVFDPSMTNVITWSPFVTVSNCGTSTAALKIELPACFAVIVDVPTPTSVTKFPLTVATAVLLLVYVISKPELAVAPGLNAASPIAFVVSALNVIAWFCFVTVTASEDELIDEPQLFTDVTKMVPLVALEVASMELVVEVPVHSRGIDHE